LANGIKWDNSVAETGAKGTGHAKGIGSTTAGKGGVGDNDFNILIDEVI
jgi:hypothetical protein